MRKPLNVTIPDDLIKKVKDLAHSEHRSVSGMVTVLLKESRANQDSKAETPVTQEA